MSTANRSVSTARPRSAASSRVSSSGKPYVSWSRNATSPGTASAFRPGSGSGWAMEASSIASPCARFATNRSSSDAAT